MSCLAALPILQHVTLSLPVLSFERWTDGVFSDPSAWRPLSASVLSPKHATVAQWELSLVSVLEARLSMERVFSGRAPESAACNLVVTSVVVGTLE